MTRWLCVLFAVLILTVGIVEYTMGLTPLEQIMTVLGHTEGVSVATSSSDGIKTIRLGIASWQKKEFPWDATIAAYEKDHPDVRVRLSIIPDGSINSQLLFWAKSNHTDYDVVVAWADEEIHPFIDYNWNTPDPQRRSLLINIRDHLTPEQLDSFHPSLFVGCSRKDPQTGQMNIYEMPWLGEVLALNYSKEYFAQRGLAKPPETWDEVEEACAKLKGLTDQYGNPVAPLSMNFANGGFFVQNCYIPMLAAFKGDKGPADDKGRLDISSPQAIETFNRLKKWYREGYISVNCMIGASVEQDLRVKRSVMYPHWQSRGLFAVKDHGSQAIGIAPSPGAKTSGALAATYGCVIPKCSPNIPEAVEFCYQAFCTDKYGFQTAVAKGWRDDISGKIIGGGKMPVLKALYSRTDLPREITDLGSALDRTYFYPDPANWTQCADIMLTEFQKFIKKDDATAEQALKTIARRFAQEVYHE